MSGDPAHRGHVLSTARSLPQHVAIPEIGIGLAADGHIERILDVIIRKPSFTSYPRPSGSRMRRRCSPRGSASAEGGRLTVAFRLVGLLQADRIDVDRDAGRDLGSFGFLVVRILISLSTRRGRVVGIGQGDRLFEGVDDPFVCGFL